MNPSQSSFNSVPFGGLLTDPFGGKQDVILTGDFFQMPPIGGVTIPSMIYQYMTTPVNQRKIGDTALYQAVEIFLQFTRMDLTFNERASDDPDHAKQVANVTDVLADYPISDDLINTLNNSYLTKDDVRDPNSPWVTKAVCITASNVERALLNDVRAKINSKIMAQIYIQYPLDIVGNLTMVFYIYN